MGHTRHWNLGAKLTLIGAPFLLLALLSLALTLWVSWQLDGGAAAVNEAGRMRMQTYRIALSAATGDGAAVAGHVDEFERSLEMLRHGDLERPLFAPWDDKVRARFAEVEQGWARFRGRGSPATMGSAAARAGCHGLRPILFIGCSDSRIVPYLLTGTGPGEFFIVRNVGAFVPPHDGSAGYHGTSAAIEFAVLNLDVAHIIVCEGQARQGTTIRNSQTASRIRCTMPDSRLARPVP